MIKMLQKSGFALVFCMMVSCTEKELRPAPTITPTDKPLIVAVTDQPIYENTATSLPTMTTSVSAANSYIGLKYPPLPSSIRTSTTWQKAIWASSWGVDTVMDEQNIMLWLKKTISHDESGHPLFQVKDVVFLPPSAREKDVVVSECVLAGQPAFEIVALVNVDQESLDNRWLPNSNIISAWRVNQSIEKLEEISTEKIECNAETFLTFPY